ncbi:MAG TPA: hypothetical protein ENF16_02985 [Bacteroidetes bacterium]|nr:hypothetical protein [Bacteroidota bacterium]
MRGRLLLVILAIGLLCAYAHASAPDSTGLPPSRSRLIPALQSAVLPGWGQLSQREWLRGGFFLLGEAFLAGDALYYWESQYDKPGWDKPGRTFDHDIALGLATWYGLGAVFCALDAYYINEPSSEGNPTLAALQSVIFPGWGQLANGQHWKAAGMFLLQTGLAFSVYYQHENYIYYDGLGLDDEARFYKDDRNRLIWWSVGAVIFSALDAFVDCHLRDWNVSEDLAVVPAYFPEQHTLGIGLRLPISSR